MSRYMFRSREVLEFILVDSKGCLCGLVRIVGIWKSKNRNKFIRQADLRKRIDCTMIIDAYTL